MVSVWRRAGTQMPNAENESSTQIEKSDYYNQKILMFLVKYVPTPPYRCVNTHQWLNDPELWLEKKGVVERAVDVYSR